MFDRRWPLVLAAALLLAPPLAAQATPRAPAAAHLGHHWRQARHGMRLVREGRRWERHGERLERRGYRHRGHKWERKGARLQHRGLRAVRRRHVRLDGRI